MFAQTCVNDTLSPRRLDECRFRSTIVDEVVGVEEQVKIFRCFRQKERFHPIFQGMITNILN
jgi:hypothetical protein